MQPYFFPYIGYWQLIYAADCFVLFDESQYINRGWVNRNRILKPDGGWQYINAPIKKHSMTKSIRDVQTDSGIEWKNLIIRQLAHYKKKASYFDETNEIVRDALFNTHEESIGAINCGIVKKMCGYMGLNKEIIISSERNFDYADIHEPGDWALRHAEQLGATEVINPVGGAALFNLQKFRSKNIALSFLKFGEPVYPQADVFEPSLSIIDVLMFNGIEGTKEFLKAYSLETAVKRV